VFKKILVGIDTATETHHAFDAALSIAKATEADLSLLHVFSWDDAHEKCLSMLHSELEGIENNNKVSKNDPLVECIISQYRGHEKPETLVKYQAAAQKAGVQANIESPRRGRPASNLCSAATIEKTDLIAVGHRDKNLGSNSELDDLHLGSVSHEIIHRAPCSVLIANRIDANTESLTHIDRILTALDNSVMDQLVFQEALDLAKETGAELTLLNVLPSSEKKHSLAKLEKLKNQAADAGVSVRVEQVIAEDDSIGKAICELAAEKEVSLTLVGRRKLSEAQEHVLGSVSHYVAYHAPCAVLIVQPS